MAEVQTNLITRSLHGNFLPLRRHPVNIVCNILNGNVTQEHHRSTSPHTILAFIVPVLLNFVEVKYQGKNVSPFETHPITTVIAITFLLVYSIAYTVEQRFSHRLPPTCLEICRGIMSISSSLLLGSLASILFPDTARPILYIFYTLLLVSELYSPANKLYHWMFQRLVDRLIRPQHAGRQASRPVLPLTFVDTSSLLSV